MFFVALCAVARVTALCCSSLLIVIAYVCKESHWNIEGDTTFDRYSQKREAIRPKYDHAETSKKKKKNRYS